MQVTIGFKNTAQPLQLELGEQAASFEADLLEAITAGKAFKVTDAADNVTYLNGAAITYAQISDKPARPVGFAVHS